MRIQNYILPLISAVLITLGCTQSFILDDSGIENPIPDAPEIPNNEIWYTSKDDTVVTPDSSANFGANIVSNTYENGKGVINFDGNIYKIGKFAFEFSSITSVILPNTVTTIERDAFSYTPLKSVYLPKNLETIEAEAFEYTSLDNIAIPDFVRNVGEFAFRATGIENVYTNYAVSAGSADTATRSNALVKTLVSEKSNGTGSVIIRFAGIYAIEYAKNDGTGRVSTLFYIPTLDRDAYGAYVSDTERLYYNAEHKVLGIGASNTASSATYRMFHVSGVQLDSQGS